MAEPEFDPIDQADVGSLIWHSSCEDSGPDVGISIKLGDSKMLWCGEITNKLHDSLDGACGGVGGWWLILYDGDESRVIAKCHDEDAAQDAFALIATIRFAKEPAP